MSDPKAKKPAASEGIPEPSKWKEFHARHKHKVFTPVFNDQLEAEYKDAGLPLEMRVHSLMLRTSWGNHSDTCADSKGVVFKQVDFAGALGVPKQRISEVLAEFEARGLVKFEGQGIKPQDSPLSPNLRSESDTVGLKANEGRIPSFSTFVAEVFAKQHPDEYRAYQDLEAARRKLMLKQLESYKAFKEQEMEKSATVVTSAPASPRRTGPSVRDVPDLASDTERTSGEPILIRSKQENVKRPSSSFSTAREAFQKYAPIDDDGFETLLSSCKKEWPKITDDDLAEVIEQKGPLTPRNVRNPAGWLMSATQNAVAAVSPKERRKAEAAIPVGVAIPPVSERIITLRQSIEQFPEHDQVDEWRAELAALEQRPQTAKGTA